MNKISIRFYNDREVRGVWSEEDNKWYFSVLDIIGVFNQQDDYEKNRNYWKYLKAKLKKEGSQLVSVTTQLKLKAAESVADATRIKTLLTGALTDKINDREMFLKGIDYSYYYEES